MSNKANQGQQREVNHMVMVRPESERRGFGPDEAALYLGLSVKTVRRRIYDGTLPARKVGTRVVVLREDLDRFLETAPRA